MAHRFASADEPPCAVRSGSPNSGTGQGSWPSERSQRGALLVLDEIQKAPNSAETVKRLWDEDTRSRRQLKVVLSGSAQLLIGRGLTESLAGRFELLHLPH